MRVGLTMIVISWKVLMAETGLPVLLVLFKIRFLRTSYSGKFYSQFDVQILLVKREIPN